MHGWLGALVATGMFFHAVRTVGAPTAAILQAATPAFAAWLGDRALSEHLLPLQAAGLALAITGMVLAIIGAAAANRK